jgi:hypothetical protein
MVVPVQKRTLLFTYLKLGYLLHLMSIAEIFMIVLFFENIDIGNWLQGGYLPAKILFLFAFVTAPLFPQCDARSRFQNYKQVKDRLYLYGFQARIIKPFSFSRCQRDAVLVAAEELGLKKECKQYFINQGYQWYHIVPTFLIKKPTYLFYKAFWLNTFFAKYYRSKIDFTKITNETIQINESDYSFKWGQLSN